MIERSSELTADVAWRQLTDWVRHADHVPFTSIKLLADPPTRLGTVFVARTGFGPLGFDDPMEITSWNPPTETTAGSCRLEKRGKIVTGWAELEVHPTAQGCDVLWRENLHVWKLPRIFDGVTAWSGKLLFSGVIKGLLR